MTTLESYSDAATYEPRQRRWTRSEYYRLGAKGFFKDQRVELIDGRVIVMPPKGNDHDVAIGLTQRVLVKAFGDDYWVRPQMSIALKPTSAPQPDLAVVKGKPEDCVVKPRSALLVVEVSESTLRYDQGRKACLYARNGITDYWIVNLVDRQLEVYRSPIADRLRPFGFRYASIVTLEPGKAIAPLSLPQIRIQVTSLLPRAR